MVVKAAFFRKKKDEWGDAWLTPSSRTPETSLSFAGFTLGSG